MDSETKKVLGEQNALRALTSHEAWPIVRSRFLAKIELLKDAFSVESSNAQKMFEDLQARKAAHQILSDFLADIEGTAQEGKENENLLNTSSHIVRG